jgi:hypothetical protein
MDWTVRLGPEDDAAGSNDRRRIEKELRDREKTEDRERPEGAHHAAPLTYIPSGFRQLLAPFQERRSATRPPDPLVISVIRQAVILA